VVTVLGWTHCALPASSAGAEAVVGAVAAGVTSMRMELNLSVKVTAPVCSARAQPSGTEIDYPLAGFWKVMKAWVSGMSPGGVDSGPVLAVVPVVQGLSVAGAWLVEAPGLVEAAAVVVVVGATAVRWELEQPDQIIVAVPTSRMSLVHWLGTAST
jgi:hypothetical protein